MIVDLGKHSGYDKAEIKKIIEISLKLDSGQLSSLRAYSTRLFSEKYYDDKARLNER
jgi:hypothetical protein